MESVLEWNEVIVGWAASCVGDFWGGSALFSCSCYRCATSWVFDGGCIFCVATGGRGVGYVVELKADVLHGLGPQNE